jgi:hypothetical protein
MRDCFVLHGNGKKKKSVARAPTPTLSKRHRLEHRVQHPPLAGHIGRLSVDGWGAGVGEAARRRREALPLSSPSSLAYL